jgi:peptidoglycan/LPS O-acetylase OafA/YrhL
LPERVRLTPIDGLRGLAAFFVVISHVYQGADYPYIAFGPFFNAVDITRSGVDLFFVLSGFCLFWPLTKPDARPNWREFFRRRALRLGPPYYATVLAVCVAPFVVVPIARAIGLPVMSPWLPSARDLWTHLLVVHTLFFDTFFNLDGPLWSLGLEVQFYLAFPLAVWLVYRFGWRSVAGIALFTLGYRIVLNSNTVHAWTWSVDTIDLFPSRWIEFVLGMAVALYVRRTTERSITPAREILDLAGIVLIFTITSFYLYGPAGNWTYPHKDLLFAGVYALILLVVLANGSLVGRFLSHPVLVWLGTISYSLYLIHLPILWALKRVVLVYYPDEVVAFFVLSAIGIPLCLACAQLFYMLFERPFLSRRSAVPRTTPAVRGPAERPVGEPRVAEASVQ